MSQSRQAAGRPFCAIATVIVTAIPITRPFFDSSEERAIADVLKSGWIVQGPRVAEFEERVAAYCGAKYAVATSSCTTALHLGLLSLGVGPGDEVIVPSFTFIASANAIEYCGAKPVFLRYRPKDLYSRHYSNRKADY